MKKMRPLQFLVPAVSVAALTACASLLGGDEVQVRRINNISTLTGEPRDPLYESAAAAIEQRDYGRALDYLQEAKARNPRNIKVLNALGVIYDKLGRFDLSARYYEQARAVDPNSRIVAANLDYSRTLQGLAPSGQGPVARLGLPENFNTGPDRNPTVLASAASATASAPAMAAPAPQTLTTLTQKEKTVVASQSSPRIEPVAVAVRETQPIAPPAPPAGAALKTEVKVAAPAPQSPAAPAHREGTVVASAPRFEPVPVAVRETRSIASPAPLALKTEVRVAAPAAIETRVARGGIPMIAAETASSSRALVQSGAPGDAGAAAIPVRSAPSRPVQQTRTAALPAVPPLVQPRARSMTAQAAGKKVFIIGQPVRIVNASGKADRVGMVSRRLGALGWTVRLSDAGRAQPTSTLVYNTRNAGAAKAMQRTLPFPVRLVADSSANGMRLLVGRDYLAWKPKNARLHALWQKGPTIASLQAPIAKGVR